MRQFVCLLPLMSGCASMFLHGAKLADHDYAPGQTGGYRVVGCAQIADATPVPPPTTTYHFITDAGGTELFERSPDGSGSLIDNKWQADDGEHYFVWVKSTGWEFVVHKDGPPTRLVYVNVSELAGTDHVTRPTTKPQVSCEMAAL